MSTISRSTKDRHLLIPSLLKSVLLNDGRLLQQYGTKGFPHTSVTIEVSPKPECHDTNGYYGLLGVSPEASKKEIRRAYTVFAKENHPDKGGDVDQFRLYTQAYEVLSNDRNTYDSLPEGIGYLGDIEVESLKRFVPKSLWGEFIDKRPVNAVSKYYAFKKCDKLAASWYDVLVPVYQALSLSGVIRLSLEEGAEIAFRRYPGQPGIIVIPTHIKPSFFIGFYIVSILLDSEGKSGRGILD